MEQKELDRIAQLEALKAKQRAKYERAGGVHMEKKLVEDAAAAEAKAAREAAAYEAARAADEAARKAAQTAAAQDMVANIKQQVRGSRDQQGADTATGTASGSMAYGACNDAIHLT